MRVSHVVRLSDCTSLAQGGRRFVFAFPGVPEYLIKVEISKDAQETKSLVKRISAHAFPDSAYKSTLKEVECELRVALKLGSEIAHSPLARSLGVVQTDRGPGVIVERISGKNGELAETLQELSDSGRLTVEILNDLNTFAKKLFDLQVVVSDFRGKNVVYGNRDGDMAFFLIDGYGERNLLPVRLLFRKVNDYQLNKRLARRAGKLGLEWNSQLREFRFQK